MKKLQVYFLRNLKYQEFKKLIKILILFRLDGIFLSRIFEWSLSFSFFYLLYTARYSSFLFSLLLCDAQRHDFLAHLLHHLGTLVLCSVSYLTETHRVGAVIMLALNPAAVFIYLTKSSIYLKRSVKSSFKKNLFNSAANQDFIIFVIIYFSTRICLFSYLFFNCIFNPQVQKPLSQISSFLLISSLLLINFIQFFWDYYIIRGLTKIGDLKDDLSDDDKTD